MDQSSQVPRRRETEGNVPEQNGTVRSGRPHRKAVRLTFEYDHDQVVLKTVQRVEMIVPVSDPVRDPETRLDSWVDLVDSEGRILFRRAVNLPAMQSIEVFSPETDRTPSRIDQPAPKGVFVVLIPDSAEGKRVAFHHAPLMGRAKAGACTETKYFPLD
jgi:hypothetical protein